MNSNKVITEFGLDALSAILHETAIEKGFWEDEVTYNVIGNKLSLVHSEVTEVLEAVRKNKGSENIVEEMADVVIRLLDLYAAMMNTEMISHSLDVALENKVNVNKERPKLHGNLF